MKDNIFIDTNVLLYLYAQDMKKKEIAKDILKSNHIISDNALKKQNNFV